MTTRRLLLQHSAVAMVGAAVFNAASCATEETQAEAPYQGHPLDGLVAFDGGAFSGGTIYQKPATLIDFWASWCQPCRVSFRYLDQLYRTWSPRGLDMVAVCVDEELSAGVNFAASMQVHFPLAWDKTTAVRGRFAVESLPATLLLDAQGAILHRSVGFNPAEHRALEDKIRIQLTAA
jgi:thiol-disulfide isomerase/thioredoxin